MRSSRADLQSSKASRMKTTFHPRRRWVYLLYRKCQIHATITAGDGTDPPPALRLQTAINASDAVTRTVAAIPGIANLIKAPEEIARDDGHPAARPTDEATEEITTVAVVSAGIRRMSQRMTGEDADILPIESLHTVVTVTEIRTTERRSLLADDVITRDPARLQGARRARTRARQYDQKRPYLRSRMHIPRLK